MSFGNLSLISLVKYVTVGQKETKIRTISLEEHGQSVQITPWRELADSSIKVEDFIEIGHCVVPEWQKKKSLNTTRNANIKVSYNLSFKNVE